MLHRPACSEMVAVKFLVLISARALFAAILFNVLSVVVLVGVIIQSMGAALAWLIGRTWRGR